MSLRTMAELVPDALEKIKELSKSALKRRAELESFAKKKSKTAPCPNSGPPHVLDLDASSRASVNGCFTLVYAPCVQCRMDADAAWLHSAGVPSILLGASLENWVARTADDRAVMRQTRKFAESGTGFHVLSGPVGLGKTHLAVGIMRERACGRMLTQNRFLLKMRDRYRAEWAENIVENCKRSRLLVLDECGFTSGSRDELPALYEVLDYRHGEKKLTVMTTNVPPEQFGEVFGDRIADRLLCHQPFVVLRGESWRGR